jgi:hypothetical protein
LKGVRLFNWIQIFTLEVLNQGHFQSHLVGDVANDYGNTAQSGALGCAPTTFARNELMACANLANY